jgi:2-methylisocitrate lyase-like PEP mutase family enzyme
MTPFASAQHHRAETLRNLHHAPALLELVNVWDVGSAHVVARTPGCSAIATASAAIAASHGYEDGENVPFDLHLDVLQRICSAVELPVTADLERGYGDVRATIEAAIDAGAVGANLEDDMCPVDEMSGRISEAVDAGRRRGVPLVVNARTDVYLNLDPWTGWLRGLRFG